MNNPEGIYEYELIDITFETEYELPEDRGVYAHEDGPEVKDKPQMDSTGSLQVQYDADGIPMGKTPEEIKMRKQIIFQFYEKWKQDVSIQ